MEITVTQYLIIAYVFVSMILGGIIAYQKKDFISRGVSISLFSGIFGPLFMIFSPPSRVREGDKSPWPDRAPEATILNIVLFVIVYYVLKYV